MYAHVVNLSDTAQHLDSFDGDSVTVPAGSRKAVKILRKFVDWKVPNPRLIRIEGYSDPTPAQPVIQTMPETSGSGVYVDKAEGSLAPNALGKTENEVVLK